MIDADILLLMNFVESFLRQPGYHSVLCGIRHCDIYGRSSVMITSVCPLPQTSVLATVAVGPVINQ